MGLTASLPRAKPTLPGCSARCIPITAQSSSTCISHAVPCTAAAPAAGQRPVLLAARNAHKALLYAAALLDFDIQWLWPAPQDAGALCSCPVSAAKLTGALQGLAQQGKRPFGVYITSPDYLRACRILQRWPKCARILAFRFWWIMPTVLTCVFCRRAVSILLRWARPCAATPAIKRCRCHWRRIPASGQKCPHSGRSRCAQCTGIVWFHQSVLPDLAVAGQMQSGSVGRLSAAAFAVLRIFDPPAPGAERSRCGKTLPGPLALESEPLKVTLDAATLGMTGTELAEALRCAKVECEYATRAMLC